MSKRPDVTGMLDIAEKTLEKHEQRGAASVAVSVCAWLRLIRTARLRIMALEEEIAELRKSRAA
jgi:hypothetical protein